LKKKSNLKNWELPNNLSEKKEKAVQGEKSLLEQLFLCYLFFINLC